MDNRVWIAVIATGLAATTLCAAEPATPVTDRSNVLAFSAGTTSNDLEYRRLFHNRQFAVIVLAGYHANKFKMSETSFPSSSGSGHETELGLGLRRNFSMRDQLRPFMQLSVLRDTVAGFCADDHALTTMATGGGEYFVGRRISLEGSAGVELAKSTTNCVYTNGSQRLRTTTLNTVRAALGFNVYF